MRRRLLFLTLIAVMLLALLPATASASSCTTRYHRVQRGEYLSRIAALYGVSMYDIARANNISNLNLLYVGRVLVIPCASTPAPPSPPSPSCVHIVRRGEWLSTIARRYGVSWWELARVNGIRNANWIYPGQRLTIPGCRPSPPSPPAPSPPTPSPPTPPPWTPPPWTPIQCDITPVLGFGRVWTTRPAVRQKLGCARAAEYSPDGAEQQFRDGIAIWRDDMDQVVALRRNGTWTLLPDPWDPCHCNPPLTSQLGWQLTGRWLYRISVQDFDGGTMIWTPGSGFYVLYNDGTWQHYD